MPTVGAPAFSPATPAQQLNKPPPAPVPSHAANLANTITVNLNELMESGDAVNNVILQAGDIVTVPHAGIVYVLGAVGKPGGYRIGKRSQPNDHTKNAGVGGRPKPHREIRIMR